jgi:hypothetical protein
LTRLTIAALLTGAAALAAALSPVAFATPAASAAPAAAQQDGWVRIAHLSPVAPASSRPALGTSFMVSAGTVAGFASLRRSRRTPSAAGQ